MKTIIFTLIAGALSVTALQAQPTAVLEKQSAALEKQSAVLEQQAAVLEQQSAVLEQQAAALAQSVAVVADTIVEKSQVADTAIIRIGKKEIKVIDRDQKHGDEQGDTWCFDSHKKDRKGKFNGHWEAFELGFNSFDKPDYSQYGGNEFMSLNQGKSLEANINFYELNIGLARNYVGLVSGMGLSFNSYRFDNPLTLERGPQRVEPVSLSYQDLSKTKLAVSYLKVPLLIEFQLPVNQREGRLYINAGLIGGVKIGSHTKVKYGDTKDKARSGFYLNNFNYAATARIGYKDMGLFANYSLTPLFEKNKGPELTPFTIGISFSN